MAFVFVPLTTAPGTAVDVGVQTLAVLADLDSQLARAGSSLANAVAMTVYLRNAEEFGRMNDAYRRGWTASLPTRTTVVAPLPPRDALVGMSAVAVRAASPRDPLHPAGWLPSANPYSYIVRSGDTVFLSGLLARSGRDQSVIGATVQEQTRAIFANARELLDTAGFTLDDVVSARVFLPDMADFDGMNQMYVESFPGRSPTRTVFAANLTAPPYKVEITFIASKRVDGDRHTDDLIASIASVDALCCRAYSA